MGGCAQYTLCRRIDTTLIPIRIRYKMSKGMAVRTYDKPRHTYTHKQHTYIHTHTYLVHEHIMRYTVKLHRKKFTTNTPLSREFNEIETLYGDGTYSIHK